MGATNFLKKAFPFLSVAATAFGGPVGAMGAQALGAALGKDVKPEQIEAELTKLTTTEEGRAKAQQAEADFKLAMAKLNYESVEALERIALEDRDSARKREIAVKDKMPLVLGGATCTIFFTVVITLLIKGVPVESKDVLLIMLGALTAGWKDVLGYYFGSSAGSAAARDTISKIAEKA